MKLIKNYLTVLFIVIAESTLLRQMYKHRGWLNLSPFASILAMISAQIHVLIGYTATLVFAHISALYSAVYIAVTAIIFIKLRQVDGLLRASSTRWFTILHFSRFARLHTKTVVTVLAIDRAMGKLMATIVAVYR